MCPKTSRWRSCQRAFDADDNLGEDTKRFIDLADPTNPTPTAQTSPVDLSDSLKPDFEKRPAAPSVRRLPEGYARHRAKNKREE
jgi:hypothetical protein